MTRPRTGSFVAAALLVCLLAGGAAAEDCSCAVEGGRIRAIEAFMRNLPYGASAGW